MKVKRIVLSVTISLILTACGYSAGLDKIAELDLRQLIHGDDPTLRRDEHPVDTVSFSPDGKWIAVLVGIHANADPKKQGFWSDLIVVEAGRLDHIVATFRITDPPFGLSTTPAIQWSLDGKRMAVAGKVFPIEGAPYCGRGFVEGFLGPDRFLAVIPAENVPPLFGGTGPARPALRLNIVGPGCEEETRIPTHELNWVLEDFSVQRKTGLFRLLRGFVNQTVNDHIVVQFPDGSILGSWKGGVSGQFINGGSGMCLGSGIDGNEWITSSCWDIGTGNKIGEIPANGGFPIMPAADAPRMIVSDLKWHRFIIFDGGRQVVSRRIVWDYSTQRELAAWSPGAQTYHSGRTHDLREQPFPSALSPDAKLVAEGGNGILRLYKVAPSQ